MFRTIRKKKNEISIDTAKALLQSSRRGVLAVNGDDGYPYAIPINVVLHLSRLRLLSVWNLALHILGGVL